MINNEPPCGYREERDERHYFCHHKNMIAQQGIIPKKVCQFCQLHSKVVDGDLWRDIARVEEGGEIKHVIMPGPGVIQMGWNLAKSIAKFIGAGGSKVSEETFRARLAICDTCPLRVGNRCSAKSCGCVLDKKAMLSTEKCPEGKW